MNLRAVAMMALAGVATGGGVVRADVDAEAEADVNAGRIGIMPTALTPPRGSVTLESDEGAVLGGSFAVTDRLLISAGALVPTHPLTFEWASLKVVAVRSDRLRIAVQAGTAAATGHNSFYNETTTGAEAAAIATICMDEPCATHVDGSVMASYAQQGTRSEPIATSLGVVARLGRHARLLLEVDTGYVFHAADGSGPVDGYAITYGLRWIGTRAPFAIDFELARPACGENECKQGVFPAGIPLVAVSYRPWQP